MNRRNLKKQIRLVCGDMAAECITAMHILPGVDKKALTDCVMKVASLQTNALAHTMVAFDKTSRDFENRHVYNHARRTYFKQAYRSLGESFGKQVEEILHQMNASIKK